MNVMKDLCVLIPIYKERPSEKEYAAIKNAMYKLNNIDMKYFGPQGISLDYYPRLKKEFVDFNKNYFSGVDGYSKLLLSGEFYASFNEYQYILILQPDVWIIRNDFDLSYYREFDYVGAPWPNGLEAYRYSFKGTSFLLKLNRAFCKPRTCHVGNGGFSLRNVTACRNLVVKYRRYARIWRTGEDVFFAYFGLDEKNEFKVATVDVAERFALEQNAKEKIEMGHIPVGVHAWEKWYPELLEKQVGM